jgi:hypothetical protein
MTSPLFRFPLASIEIRRHCEAHAFRPFRLPGRTKGLRMTCCLPSRAFAALALSVLALALPSIAPAARGETVRLRILGGPETAPPAMPGVEILRGDGAADLIWDRADAVVYTGAGEIAAEGIEAAGIAAAAAKWAAARSLAAASNAAPLALELLPPGTHRSFGETIRLRSEVLPHPYLLVVNLSLIHI